MKKKRPAKMKRSYAPNSVMSECAAKYAYAVADPFSPKGIGACVPTFPARLSQKSFARTQFTFAIGTSKCGFVAVAPCLSNNGVAIYRSGSGYSSTDKINCSDVAVTSSSFSALPYDNSYFLDGSGIVNSSVTGRVVSCGLRIRYDGTELNKGGTVYGLVMPDHGNIDQMTTALMTSYRESFNVPVRRGWVDLAASAVDQHECEYPDAADFVTLGSGNLETLSMTFPFSQNTAINGTNLGVGAPIMGFIVTGLDGNTFIGEVIINVEYVGRVCNPQSTRSHSDQVGLSQVMDAVGSAQVTRSDNYVSNAVAVGKQLLQTVLDNPQAAVNTVRVVGSILGRQR